MSKMMRSARAQSYAGSLSQIWHK